MLQISCKRVRPAIRKLHLRMFNGFGGPPGYGGMGPGVDGSGFQPGYGGEQDYGSVLFGPGEALAGYPRGLILQRNDVPQPQRGEAFVSRDLVYQEVIDLLRKDDEVGAASARNNKLRAEMETLAKKIAQEAAFASTGKAAQLAASVAYIERQTLIPPSENLSLIDINLLETFIRHPGIGPFLLCFMIFGYGGLLEELTEEQREKRRKDRNLEQGNSGQSLQNRIMRRDTTVRVEQLFKFLNNSNHEEMHNVEVEFMTQGYEAAKDVATHLSQNNPFKSGQNDDNDQNDDMTEMEITSPFHIAILPVAMLFVQFSYIFFIFYEAWKGYSGGTCPGYEYWTNSRIEYPDGANAQTRILICFIAAFFCVRILQQLLAFAHALEGQHIDGGETFTDHLVLGFIPKNFQRFSGLLQKIKEKITTADWRLQALGMVRPDPITIEILRKEDRDDARGIPRHIDQFDKGMVAYLNSIYEDIWNIKGLMYDRESSNVAELETSADALTEQFLSFRYLSRAGKRQIDQKRQKREADLGKPAQDRNIDAMVWRNIKWSWLFPFYIGDCVVQLILMICVFLVNLYIVFIDGVSARDMVLNVVLLDFIYEQLPKFKHNVFKSEKAKALIRTLKIAHQDPPRNFLWKMQCRFAKSVGLQTILIFSFCAFLISFAVIIYGPICKPGPNTAGALPAVDKPN